MKKVEIQNRTIIINLEDTPQDIREKFIINWMTAPTFGASPAFAEWTAREARYSKAFAARETTLAGVQTWLILLRDQNGETQMNAFFTTPNAFFAGQGVSMYHSASERDMSLFYQVARSNLVNPKPDEMSAEVDKLYREWQEATWKQKLSEIVEA